MSCSSRATDIAMSDEIKRRAELVLRGIGRGRFFSDGGLYDRYERLGDHLVQFGEIVDQLTATVPGLSRDAVIRRFLFSAKNHWFGRYGWRQTIEQLIDLDNRGVPCGMYSLRPSYIRVEAHPKLMRARRSVWAQWIQAQGWPVPPELGKSAAGNNHPGGRPPEVSSAVELWYNNLLVEDRTLSATKLAQMWILENPHLGKEESVRQIIGKLRQGPLKKT
jgi:hypothetical protein